MITREDFKNYYEGIDITELKGWYKDYDISIDGLIDYLEVIENDSEYVYFYVYRPDCVGLIVNGQQQFLAKDYDDLLDKMKIYISGWKRGKED